MAAGWIGDGGDRAAQLRHLPLALAGVRRRGCHSRLVVALPRRVGDRDRALGAVLPVRRDAGPARCARPDLESPPSGDGLREWDGDGVGDRVLAIGLTQVSTFDVAAGGELEQFVLTDPGRGSESASITFDVRRRPPNQLPTPTTVTSTTLVISDRRGGDDHDGGAVHLDQTPPRRRRCRCYRDRWRSWATRRRTRCSSTCRGGSATTSASKTARSSGCSVHDSGEVITARPGSATTSASARAGRASGRRAADRSDVALVVLGAWDVFDLRLDDHVVEFASAEYDRLFTRRLRAGLDALAFAGAHAALLEIACMRPVDARGAAVPALPERGDDARVAHVNMLLRRAAARDPEHVTFIEGPDEWCERRGDRHRPRLPVGRRARLPARRQADFRDRSPLLCWRFRSIVRREVTGQ